MCEVEIGRVVFNSFPNTSGIKLHSVAKYDIIGKNTIHSLPKEVLVVKIKGLQKLTLLDFPEKIACTVFTGGCNFKCPFCHNASLVTHIDDQYIDEDEFFTFLSKRKGVLQGVCITGGEPTLQPDLKDFIRKIKELGFAVKLDTNGYRPDILKSLVKQNLLDYVAMDIKNSPERYGETVGIENFDLSPIQESIDFLLSDVVPFEFRTTVVRELHTPQDIEHITEWISPAKRYFLQAFHDSGDLIETGFSGYDKDSMENLFKIVKSRMAQADMRGV